jgi:hypothetical protein
MFWSGASGERERDTVCCSRKKSGPKRIQEVLQTDQRQRGEDLLPCLLG